MKRRTYSFESLESRQLLTIATELVADIRDGQTNSDSGGFGGEFIEYKGELYFSANNGEIGRELWKSDGTADGTQLVKDIYVGDRDDSSSPGWFSVYNDELYFIAADNRGGELWKTDGTEEGTVLVKDISEGMSNSFASDLTVFNDAIYFPAANAQDDSELWRSDGTTAGTVELVDIRLDGSSSPAEGSGFYEFNGHLYFNARDDDNGVELWRTDGTSEGTELVIDADPGDGSSWPLNFAEFNGDLYFFAEVLNEDVDNFLPHLFRVDGETGEAERAFEFAVDEFQGITVMGDHFYFSAITDDEGFEPFMSDGTPEGTMMLRDILTGPNSSSPRNFFAHNDKVYFTAGDTLDPETRRPIHNLWVTDGTQIGTRKVAPIEVNSNHALVEYQNEVYFTGRSETLGWELHKTDGTALGTEVAADIVTGEGDSFAIAKQVFDGSLLFLATEPNSGWEIWAYDGVSTAMLDTHTGGGDVTDDPTRFKFFEYGNNLIYNGSNPFFGVELFIIRGTEQPERLEGDADENGEVGFLDFLRLANNFGKENAEWGDGDFDGSGTVNFLDFLILANNFGRTATPALAAEAPAAGEPGLRIGVAAADEVYADNAEDDSDLL